MTKALQVPLHVRALCMERDDNTCRRCQRSVLYVAGSLHHRYPRGMGGSRDERINDPRNLVTLCGSGTTMCHGWVHQHPTSAIAEGWTLGSLDYLNRPVIDLWGVRLVFFEDGRAEYLHHPTHPPGEER